MQLSSTLVKTAKGLEEIDKRTYKLSGRLRAVMFVIDGQRTVGALLDQAGNMASQLETQLNELLGQGFISEVLSDEEVAAVEAQSAKPVVEPSPNSNTAKPKPVSPVAAIVNTAAKAATTQPTPTPTPTPTLGTTPKKPDTTATLPKRAQEPVAVIKVRLSKMLAETMGMRAMFITSQLNGLQTHLEIERFIDDTARANATTTGAKAAEEWRIKARAIASFE
jgi:hypothetical protein